ncbi:MAG: RluA family pseudouridine synthase [Patescibacteria group bacterium]|jgi:23S rRNA pseudouridine1911/1915/1917 synthase
MLSPGNKIVNKTVTSADSGQRLDKILVKLLPDVSRSQIQKLIKSGTVLVNGKIPVVHQFLKTGDIININRAQVSLPARGDEMPKTENQSQARRPGLGLILDVIADTPDYLVINKPAGLLVHEAPNTNEPTVVDLILKKYPEIKKVGEDPQRPGIVHRLDKQVSGLLVIAKTQNMFDHLKNQFKTRQTRKDYLALVYGQPQKNAGEISFNIDRSSTIDHKMAAVPTHEERGRRAVTKFEVAESFPQYSLLKISPLTGRTHQIRVHLNAYGLPIVGDETYKPKKLKTKIRMPRIFLHAYRLGFFDLKNGWQEFTAPLPPELEQLLKKLRNH